MGIINKNKFKQMALKVCIMLFWLVWLLTPSFQKVSAANWELDARDWLNYIVEIAWAYMDQYFSMVHYNVAWNDFWWGILWLPVEQISWDVVEITIPSNNEQWADARYCSSKVRGFYWNSQRWDNRLWPMDDKTHEWLKAVNPDNDKYAWLTISWWWYTTCSEDKTTVELNTFLIDKWITINISDLKSIVADLSKYEKSQWGEHIEEILSSGYNIGDSVAKEKIKNAILSWATFEIDSYGIYGNITHNYKWEEIHLIAWAHYDMVQNRITTGDLTCSLQRLSNNYPFWYVYDDYWHIWLIWARIASSYVQGTENNRKIVSDFHQWLNQLMNTWWKLWKWICMNEIFWFDWKDMNLTIKKRGTWYNIPWRSDDDSIRGQIKSLDNFLNAWNWTARTTVFSLWIKWIVWLTEEMRDSQKQYFENNQLQSTLMLRTETSISNIVNSVSKNAERICRWKWQKDWVNWGGALPDVICLSWASATSYKSPTPKQISWKTIVVKNADLIVDMSNSDGNGYQWNNDSIDLFIDRGNLILNSSWITQDGMKSFDDYWYLVDSSELKAMFLKGNFVINGLLLWWVTWNEPIKSRLYIHGKLVSYNTITVPNTNRKRTIAYVIGRGWDENSVPVWTSLTKLFEWSCDAVSWIGTDWTSCKWSSAVGKESQLVDKAFWLIDMDIKSNLIKY